MSPLSSVDRIRLGRGRLGWGLAVVELYRLWQRRPPLKKRALLFLAWRFLPPNVKLIALGVSAATIVVFAGALAALGFGLSQLA
jgi:hypothetical protein